MLGGGLEDESSRSAVGVWTHQIADQRRLPLGEGRTSPLSGEARDAVVADHTRIQGQHPHFTGPAMSTMQQPPRGEHTGAQTLTGQHHGQIIDPLSNSPPAFRHRRKIGVIFEQYVPPSVTPELGPQSEIKQGRQLVTGGDVSLPVHRGRHADPHREHRGTLHPRFLQGLLDGALDRLDALCRCRVQGAAGNTLGHACQFPTVEVGDFCRDRGDTEVQPNHTARVLINGESPRRATSPNAWISFGFELAHPSPSDQIITDGDDGGAGETGALNEVRACHNPAATHHVQHGGQVRVTQGVRCGGFRVHRVPLDGERWQGNNTSTV